MNAGFEWKVFSARNLSGKNGLNTWQEIESGNLTSGASLCFRLGWKIVYEYRRKFSLMIVWFLDEDANLAAKRLERVKTFDVKKIVLCWAGYPRYSVMT